MTVCPYCNGEMLTERVLESVRWGRHHIGGIWGGQYRCTQCGRALISIQQLDEQISRIKRTVRERIQRKRHRRH